MSIPPREAQQRLLHGGMLVIDVRDPHEFRAGHISGAWNIPLHRLQSRLDDLPRDRDILCTCNAGNRSGQATRRLNSLGFTAYLLDGGLLRWSANGYPLAVGD
jgi:rhodanese-related sulfurtransferase